MAEDIHGSLARDRYMATLPVDLRDELAEQFRWIDSESDKGAGTTYASHRPPRLCRCALAHTAGILLALPSQLVVARSGVKEACTCIHVCGHVCVYV